VPKRQLKPSDYAGLESHFGIAPGTLTGAENEALAAPERAGGMAVRAGGRGEMKQKDGIDGTGLVDTGRRGRSGIGQRGKGMM